nr:protein ALWAYS EARLY 3-like [Coffea arabica]
MAPARKSRSVNKRHLSINEVSPIKGSSNGRRNSKRKRKPTNKLGPQWSKEEITRFYEAYRKYGQDFKKVAAAVRNRSVDMVDALFSMNRAYLALPEGTASVIGLVAMMTDYYSNLAITDSEQESNDGAGASRKAQRHTEGKGQPSTTKASDGHFSRSPTVTAGYGFQSLLKKKRSGGSRARAVGKRTPRVPVAYSYENNKGEKFFSTTRRGDDDVAHEIALALTEASQRGGSPQVSQTPSRRTESVMSSPARNAETRRAELKMANYKHVESDVDEEELEGSMEADTGELSRYKTYLKQTGRVGSLVPKGRRFDGKRLDVDDSSDNHLEDTREACSGTEEGQRFGAARYADARNSKSSYQGPRKRSKKVLFRRDEDSAFDALQTLADLSLMLPAEANEDESMVEIKDEHVDHVDESGSLEAIPAPHQRDKRRSSGQKIKGDQSTMARLEMASTKIPKSGKMSLYDVSVVPEVKDEVYPSKSIRKKPKILTSKIRKSETHVNSQLSEPQEAETRDLGKMIKNKKSSHSSSPKLVKNVEHSSSADPRIEGSDSAQSTIQAPPANQVNLLTRVRSRRKRDLNKPQIQKDLKLSEKISNDRSNVPLASVNDTAFSVKGKLANCLSNHRLRRWCAYEWFYNAIDYPWFAKREFVEYLYHVGLGHVPRLTRVEWGVIRSSLGKPRRFSQQFLKEEKEKLNKYRDSVRTHYTELRKGIREGLPTDLARPLTVGQRVIAIHPKTREIHDGSVLTVDHSRCRVQFDRPELGVEFVMDVDCMPLDPMENIPTMLARHIAVDKFFENYNELRMNEQAKEYIKISSGDNVENINGLSNLSSSTYPVTNLLKQTKVAPEDANLQIRAVQMETPTNTYSQPCIPAQVQAKEADVQALAQLTRALDKKEAVVSELKRMNDDVVENCSLKESESFKKQYAAVLVQLHEVNEQVSSALICLRQRNTYQGNISLGWPRPVANLGDPGSMLSSLDRSTSQSQDSGSHISEIIESSRKKARSMVDVALQAMSSLKGRENTFEKIEEAIDYVNEQLPSDDSSVPAAPDPNLKNATDRNEAQIPSELITQCVATLLMIQKCTERQFPPADVAQILDSAVTSLKPCCPQNLPVYTEIQKCMGIVRNQILALIPT